MYGFSYVSGGLGWKWVVCDILIFGVSYIVQVM